MLRLLEEGGIVGTIVSSIGTMISIGLNLSPILLFYRFFKKTAPIETIPETMFITGIFCCATNLAYGILIEDTILIIRIHRLFKILFIIFINFSLDFINQMINAIINFFNFFIRMISFK